MTATEPASLDALDAAVPVEAEPFDLAALIEHQHWCLYIGHGECCGNTEEDDCDCGATDARDAIARHVNAERVRTEDARRVAANLEADAARTDLRIREALGYLGDALVWATDANAADCVQEAIAALKGES